MPITEREPKELTLCEWLDKVLDDWDSYTSEEHPEKWIPPFLVMHPLLWMRMLDDDKFRDNLNVPKQFVYFPVLGMHMGNYKGKMDFYTSS